MKTFKTLSLFILVPLFFNCSNNDDNTNSTPLSVIELLTSGKWYLESKTPGSFTACEKKGYVEFSNNSDVALNLFDDTSGTCESNGIVNGTFTLTNNNIVINAAGEVLSLSIDTISENEMTATSSTETIVFDKTEG